MLVYGYLMLVLYFCFGSFSCVAGELLPEGYVYGRVVVCASSLWAGTLIRMDVGRLSTRVMLGKLADGVRQGRFGKGEWATCVESKVWPFNIDLN